MLTVRAAFGPSLADSTGTCMVAPDCPEIGEVKLFPWKPLDNLWEVQQIIGEIRLWDEKDEKQLTLDDAELEAFGVRTDTHAKHMLNAKGVAPCALHAWGSQLRACPCGCRKYGFSACRLATKGLHGCLVRSAVQYDGSSVIRHIHPNETMGLNTMDPVLDFGENVCLTLSAAGQLACPIQALWTFGTLAARLDEMKQQPVFTPDSQIQAYRSWLLMRCRQVWSPPDELIQDEKLLAMVGFWGEFHDLSLAELVFPLRWEGKISGSVNIASILDHLIRSKEAVPVTVSDATQHDDEPTPWMDFPIIADDPTTAGCMQADSCTVVFEDSEDSPIRFQPKCCATVSQFLLAHAKLVESLDVESITLNNNRISVDHVMEVGQLIVIRTRKAQPLAARSDEIIVSPTAEWSQLPQDPIETPTPPRKVPKVSKFDVGECIAPAKCDVPDQPWLDATPFMQLQGEQFLKLSPPSVTNTQQLWSVRHQFFRSVDRLKILDAQQQFWADDEVRFHLQALTIVFRDHQLRGNSPVIPVCVIDPLIFTSWVVGKGFDCGLWAKDHPEILKQGIPIITVVLIDQHWIPVYLTPIKQVLHAFTWDRAEAAHAGLQHVIHKLAVSLGFADAMMRREHRLFFTSELCGSLAIEYLRYALVGTQLPTDCHEAVTIHAMLRAKYVTALQSCDIVDRPWIWGAGDANESASSSTLPAVTVPDVNVTRDQRIDLINERGLEMADDEIRFHLLNMIEKQPVHSSLVGRTFTFIEPLVHNCWTSIGKIIVEQWCQRNKDVYSQGVNVISAFSVNAHWVPLWFSPRSTVLQVHLIQIEGLDTTGLDEIIELISNTLGYMSYAIHRVPDSLPEHTMCGAFAMSFLAHVVMGMPLPTDLAELRTLHTNMRASFVAYLYSVESTPRPVIWGAGKKAVRERDDVSQNPANEVGVVYHWQLAQPSEQPLPPGLQSRPSCPGDRIETVGKASASNLVGTSVYEGSDVAPDQLRGYHEGKQLNVRAVNPTPVPPCPGAPSPSNDPEPVQHPHVSQDRSASSSWESGPLPKMPVAVIGRPTDHLPLQATRDVSLQFQDVLPVPDGQQTQSSRRDATEPLADAGASVDSPAPWESWRLPRIPDESASSRALLRENHAQIPPSSQGTEETPKPQPVPMAPTDEERQIRLLQVTSHSYAMADDEMHFQLHHLMQCHHVNDTRKFLFAPPLAVFQWTVGDPIALNFWLQDKWIARDPATTHLLVALLVERHWIPVWFAPSPEGLHAHTLANFASDEPLIDSVLHLFSEKLGEHLHLIHRVPHGIQIDRLCGTMTISFFAHVMLRTAMPRTIEELQARCWNMKEVFADSLQNGPVTMPSEWGWGILRECRLLPVIMPVWSTVQWTISKVLGLCNDDRVTFV